MLKMNNVQIQSKILVCKDQVINNKSIIEQQSSKIKVQFKSNPDTWTCSGRPDVQRKEKV